MKNGFQIHTPESVPAASLPFLTEAQSHYGFIPNAIGAMAESPSLLKAYLTLDNLLESTAFSENERHILLLAITREFECSYCVAAHSAFAKMAGLPVEQVDHLRNGEPLTDPKLEQLEHFAGKMVSTQGQVSDADVQAMLAVGYSHQHILEVLLLIANKLMAVYANRLMGTDLDEALQSEAWTRVA